MGVHGKFIYKSIILAKDGRPTVVAPIHSYNTRRRRQSETVQAHKLNLFENNPNYIGNK